MLLCGLGRLQLTRKVWQPWKGGVCWRCWGDSTAVTPWEGRIHPQLRAATAPPEPARDPGNALALRSAGAQHTNGSCERSWRLPGRLHTHPAPA